MGTSGKSAYPSPRIWSHSPAAQATLSLGSISSHTPLSPVDTSSQNQQHSALHKTNKGLHMSNVKHAIKTIGPKLQGRVGRPTSTGPRLEFQGASNSRSRSPSPVNFSPIDHPLSVSDTYSNIPSKKGRGQIVGSLKKVPSSSTSKEMSENPKSFPSTDVSSSQLDKLKNRIDDLQAKCLYCGGKADTFITSLQSEIIQLEGLPPEAENTLLLALAGLKQVRDLLLNKIPFSGEMASGWDDVRDSKSNLEDSNDGSLGSSTNLESVTLSSLASKSSPPVDDSTGTSDTINSTRTINSDQPLQTSVEVGTEVLADDSSSQAHPLLNSED